MENIFFPEVLVHLDESYIGSWGAPPWLPQLSGKLVENIFFPEVLLHLDESAIGSWGASDASPPDPPGCLSFQGNWWKIFFPRSVSAFG